jgi:antirestriction protein ArdC
VKLSRDYSGAYIQSWIRALKNDKTMIVSASGKAEKAIEFILG